MVDTAAALREREARGLLRRRRTLESPQGPQVRVDGRSLLTFCSNDYLGLANHPEVREAMQDGVARHGVGSGASHLVCGHHEAHERLEAALAEVTGREAALLFSTGYMANLGVITAFAGRGQQIFQDRLNHASLLDGAQLSGARLQRYPHNDIDALRQRLSSARAPALVATDGVFSMDGDRARLPELVACCHEAGVPLLVDDAHGIGVLGAKGGGLVEEAALGEDDVPLLIGTLGKALGVGGAFVAGSRETIQYLIQCARTYIYTTAMPPAMAEATLCSLRLSVEQPWRRERLQRLIARFREDAAGLGYKLMPSETPIQPLMVGESEQAVALSDALERRGVLVTAIRPPTVPVGTARLRVTLSAAHTDDQLAQLLDALREAGHEVGCL